MSSAAPVIGIRDSGVGGLTVARRVRELLPASPLLYFADTAHVPYGERTPAEVSHFALSISQFLIEQGAQIIVFACNTSSAYALTAARHQFAMPIIGMIEPGARAAHQVSRNRSIGVLATQATVESGIYSQVLRQLDAHLQCREVACPDFVPLVESEQTTSAAARAASLRYLKPLLQSGADTIVLGCTHYPLLLPVLQEAAPHVQFVDPAEAVACQVQAVVQNLGTSDAGGQQAPRDVFFVSGPRDGVEHWIQKLLPQRPIDLRPGPIFDCSTTFA